MKVLGITEDRLHMLEVLRTEELEIVKKFRRIQAAVYRRC